MYITLRLRPSALVPIALVAHLSTLFNVAPETSTTTCSALKLGLNTRRVHGTTSVFSDADMELEQAIRLSLADPAVQRSGGLSPPSILVNGRRVSADLGGSATSSTNASASATTSRYAQEQRPNLLGSRISRDSIGLTAKTKPYQTALPVPAKVPVVTGVPVAAQVHTPPPVLDVDPATHGASGSGTTAAIATAAVIPMVMTRDEEACLACARCAYKRAKFATKLGCITAGAVFPCCCCNCCCQTCDDKECPCYLNNEECGVLFGEEQVKQRAEVHIGDCCAGGHSSGTNDWYLWYWLGQNSNSGSGNGEAGAASSCCCSEECGNCDCGGCDCGGCDC